MSDTPSFASYFIQVTIQTFRSMKKLADKAMIQLGDEQFAGTIDAESNSVEVIILHMHGNMISRWTDFLTTDGEKEYRDRDGEFAAKGLSRVRLLELWEEGWSCLFQALDLLGEEDLMRTVTIRGEAHSVLQAIQRQVSHYAYHIGQIVFLAKHLQSHNWQTLSIARGKSKDFRP
jgi:hypothetical protein